VPSPNSTIQGLSPLETRLGWTNQDVEGSFRFCSTPVAACFVEVRGTLRQAATSRQLFMDKFDDGSVMVVHGSVHQAAAFKVDGTEDGPRMFVA
jgi:hypothetical protein